MTRTRALTEYGPLILFFVCNYVWGIMPATAVLVATTVIATAYTVYTERRIPWMPVIGAVLVSVFGGLALVFDDAFFLKIKPTVATLLIAAGLAFGLLIRKYFLRTILNGVLELDDTGWRNLTIYWICAFCIMAAANEVAWRTLSTDGWVTFKAFGLTGLSVVAAIGAAPLMKAVRGGES
ncbi:MULTISPECIES: inner membrane-spanning protein YciB [Thalassobaculum]|uniref:Inner membrane-spanning protein YciB n=1 Tax=Thalassobaculum litoreum DSM 18839 TaxID=1123362 RepID=A0A8G2BH78_9PROT|nr:MULTISPECIES: inner membrane-spanning protein YciB [Thalassobaculum]SDF40510.1 intracellular septation protein [Thalassobaculum litoreum DSM 18839]